MQYNGWSYPLGISDDTALYCCFVVLLCFSVVLCGTAVW